MLYENTFNIILMTRNLVIKSRRLDFFFYFKPVILEHQIYRKNMQKELN